MLKLIKDVLILDPSKKINFSIMLLILIIEIEIIVSYSIIKKLVFLQIFFK